MSITKSLGNSALPIENITRGIHVPAAATAAIVSESAVVGTRYVIHNIQWSYSATPTNGRLTVSDGTTRLDLDITAAGPGVIPVCIPCDEDAAMTVTLASGGGTVVGKLNVQYSKER